MTTSSRPDRIRVHLSIYPGTPAYDLLEACDVDGRRDAAMAMIQAHALAIKAGYSATPQGQTRGADHRDVQATTLVVPSIVKRDPQPDSGAAPPKPAGRTYSRARAPELAGILSLNDL
jgi:hypothetical protein